MPPTPGFHCHESPNHLEFSCSTPNRCDSVCVGACARMCLLSVHVTHCRFVRRSSLYSWCSGRPSPAHAPTSNTNTDQPARERVYRVRCPCNCCLSTAVASPSVFHCRSTLLRRLCVLELFDSDLTRMYMEQVRKNLCSTPFPLLNSKLGETNEGVLFRHTAISVRSDRQE